MADLKISPAFSESADRLPKEVKLKLIKVFKLLTSNPRHPSLQLKKISGAARNDLYECRVDLSIRLILQQLENNTLNLICVNQHDEAIQVGLAVREPAEPYGPDTPALKGCRAFLAGDEQALEFVAVSQAELEAFLKK